MIPATTDERGSPLTLARRAVMHAIDNWGPLANTFRSKLYFEKPERASSLMPPDYRDVPSGLADLPCLRVDSLSGRHDKTTNRTGVFPYTVEIALWFPPDQRDAAELAAWEVMYALWNSKPAGSHATYIDAVGCREATFEPWRFARVQLSDAAGMKAIFWQTGLTFQIGTQWIRS